MAQTIPISQVVTINPGVIGTGGNPLSLNGVFVSTDDRIPVGQILSFPSADDVARYFGVNSDIAALANNYFLSFDNSQKKPQSMIFTPWCKIGRAAWVRGTSIAGTPFSDIKKITGDLSVTIDGTVFSTDALDFSQTTNFTEVATAIQTALNCENVAQVTWDAAFSQFVIAAKGTGKEHTVSAVTGTAAVGLGLSSGYVSQGTGVETPAETMERIKELSLNWASFTVVDKTEDTEKANFAIWTNNQNRRYLYVPWDDNPLAAVRDSECFAATVKKMKYEAVLPVFDRASVAAMAMGTFASVDWDAIEGRVDLAFKSQSGLPATASDLNTAEALLANGYSYYGAYAGAGEDNLLNFFYDGRLPGSSYGFSDTYTNQIFLNSQLQLAIISLLTGVRSLPYNADGYSKLRLACATPIAQALKNGTIRTGVSLSDLQKAQVISAIGFDVSKELYSQGYYLYIGDATAQVRGQRKSPPMTLLYMDGGSVHQITLGSIVIR